MVYLTTQFYHRRLRIVYTNKKFQEVFQKILQNYSPTEIEKLIQENTYSEDPIENRVFNFLKDLNLAGESSIYLSGENQKLFNTLGFAQEIARLEAELTAPSLITTEIANINRLVKNNLYTYEERHPNKKASRFTKGKWKTNCLRIGQNAAGKYDRNYSQYVHSVNSNSQIETERVTNTLYSLAKRAAEEKIQSYAGWQKYYKEHPYLYELKSEARQKRVNQLRIAEINFNKKLEQQITTLKENLNKELANLMNTKNWLEKSPEERNKDELTDKIANTEFDENFLLEQIYEKAKNTLEKSRQIEYQNVVQYAQIRNEGLQYNFTNIADAIMASYMQDAQRTVNNTQTFATPEYRAKLDRKYNNLADMQGISKHNSHHYVGGSYEASQGWAPKKDVVYYFDLKTGARVGYEAALESSEIEAADIANLREKARKRGIEIAREKALNLAKAKQENKMISQIIQEAIVSAKEIEELKEVLEGVNEDYQIGFIQNPEKEKEFAITLSAGADLGNQEMEDLKDAYADIVFWMEKQGYKISNALPFTTKVYFNGESPEGQTLIVNTDPYYIGRVPTYTGSGSVQGVESESINLENKILINKKIAEIGSLMNDEINKLRYTYFPEILELNDFHKGAYRDEHFDKNGSCGAATIANIVNFVENGKKYSVMPDSVKNINKILVDKYGTNNKEGEYYISFHSSKDPDIPSGKEEEVNDGLKGFLEEEYKKTVILHEIDGEDKDKARNEIFDALRRENWVIVNPYFNLNSLSLEHFYPVYGGVNKNSYGESTFNVIETFNKETLGSNEYEAGKYKDFSADKLLESMKKVGKGKYYFLEIESSPNSSSSSQSSSELEYPKTDNDGLGVI